MKTNYAKEIVKTLEMDGVEASVVKVKKNNDITLTGISVKNESNVCPTIYIDKMYENNMSIEEAAREVASIAKNNAVSDICVEDIVGNFETVKDNIIFEIVNGKQTRIGSKENDIIGIPVLGDLAKIYKVVINDDSFSSDGVATITINNAMVSSWGVTIDEIDEVSNINTPRLREAEIMNIATFLSKYYGMPLSEAEKANDEMPMYIVTNDKKLGGAATILYKDTLKSLADNLRDNLVILPSSIHEVLILPARKAGEISEFAQMIQEINSAEVSPEEVLSNHPYVFYRDSEQIIAA